MSLGRGFVCFFDQWQIGVLRKPALKVSILLQLQNICANAKQLFMIQMKTMSPIKEKHFYSRHALDDSL